MTAEEPAVPTDPDQQYLVTVSTVVEGAEPAAASAERLAGNLRQAITDLPRSGVLSISVARYEDEDDEDT